MYCVFVSFVMCVHRCRYFSLCVNIREQSAEITSFSITVQIWGFEFSYSVLTASIFTTKPSLWLTLLPFKSAIMRKLL